MNAKNISSSDRSSPIRTATIRTISTRSTRSSTESVKINNLIDDAFDEKEAEPIAETHEISPTPLTDSIGVVMEEASAAITTGVDMTEASTDLKSDTIKEDSSVNEAVQEAIHTNEAIEEDTHSTVEATADTPSTVIPENSAMDMENMPSTVTPENGMDVEDVASMITLEKAMVVDDVVRTIVPENAMDLDNVSIAAESIENSYNVPIKDEPVEAVENADNVPITAETVMSAENENAPSINEPVVAEPRPLVSEKRARKPLNITTAKPQARIVAKPPPAPPAKKRTYTRKNRIAASVNVGEEVSILSSSSSDEFERESINIMSSSSSSSRHSISSIRSVTSVLSTKESVNSKTSKVSKASKTSTTSNSSKESKASFASKASKTSKESKTSSTESVNSSVSIVEDWVKAACPAIFMKSNLSNPERKYFEIKQKITHLIAANPQIIDEELHQRLQNRHSAASIQQVIQVVRETETPVNKTPSVPKKQRDAAADDFEVLKKLSTTLSGRKRKIRSEEGEWIDPNEIEGRVISHEPATPAKEKRKRKYVRKEVVDGVGDLNTTEDPFRLILLNDYEHDHANEDYDVLKAPFIVEMCSSVILLMDLHSHLHSSEIIGLLGGTMQNDLEVPVLRINYGYPCLTAHSTGTQVDVDPLSEMEAGEFFESKNVRMTGWYHSHPNFEPNPSLRDLETQTMYQGLFRNAFPGSDIEPFVGVIVNPYLAITESSSHVECFYVAPNPDPSQERLPYRLPIRRKPFNPVDFPEIFEKMREIVFRAQSSPDRLDMQKNAEPGVKRIEKLFKSLQFHGDLTSEQMEQIKELFK